MKIVERAPKDDLHDDMKAEKFVMQALTAPKRWETNQSKTSSQHFLASCLVLVMISTVVITPCHGLAIRQGDDVVQSQQGVSKMPISQADSGLPFNDTLQVGKPRIHSLSDPKSSVKAAATASYPIVYHIGKPVLTGTVKVYILYYGSWSSTQKGIVQTFISSLGSTTWYNIEKTYYYQATSASPKTYVSGPLILGTTWDDGYSVGRTLSGMAIPNLIYSHIQKGHFPNDPQGIYLLLSSADIYETDPSGRQSFCVNYCGYHSAFIAKSTTYIYGFVGNPTRCITGCTRYNYNKSPNGDIGVDAMLSPIAHELVETVSDPLLNAWYDSSYEENADKCGYTYGNVYRLSSGAYYNLVANNRYYLVQQNWNAKSQACAMSA